MDLLTGLLLTGVVLWIITIVIRELFDVSISAALKRYFRAAPNPVQDTLVGAIGKVIELPEDGDTRLRVRVGIEIWSARLAPSHQRTLPVGAEVRVTAVDGMILDVEEYAAA